MGVRSTPVHVHDLQVEDVKEIWALAWPGGTSPASLKVGVPVLKLTIDLLGLQVDALVQPSLHCGFFDVFGGIGSWFASFSSSSDLSEEFLCLLPPFHSWLAPPLFSALNPVEVVALFLYPWLLLVSLVQCLDGWLLHSWPDFLLFPQSPHAHLLHS